MRYILFRLGPVALTAFLVATYVHDLGGNPLSATLFLALAHSVVSSGSALVAALRSSRNSFARSTRIATHAIVPVGILVATVGGLQLSYVEGLRVVVPTPRGLSESLWTALFAGVFGAFLVGASEGKQPSIQELVDDSRARLDPELWQLAGSLAKDASFEPRLVQSILLVENLQRPAWIRRLESIKGVVLREGTYGVMQVRASKPINDRLSIHRAIDEHIDESMADQVARGNDEALVPLLRSYNPDAHFVTLAESFYYSLPDEREVSEDWGDSESEDNGEQEERDEDVALLLAVRRKDLGVAAFLFGGVTVLLVRQALKSLRLSREQS
jgi:hypothetical protein